MMQASASGRPPTSDPSPEVEWARAFLSRVAEPAHLGLWAFVHEQGPVDAVRAIRERNAPERILAATAARAGSVDPDADLEAGRRHGARLVTPESAEWPHFAFRALEHTARRRIAERRARGNGTSSSGRTADLVPPHALWVRGSADLASLGVRSVAIVGARAATAYGERVALDLAFGLARAGFVVVSGGAFGIDAAAHRGALAAAGRTVIVSAGGVDKPYPPANQNLYLKALDDGLVLSESPPGAHPQRGRFLTRNRLVAALSTGVVVVEASLRSGALNTANHASGLGRPLMVVPGPVTSAVSAGCHRLLRDETREASLVTCVDDVLEVVGSAGDLPPLARPDACPGDPRGRLDDLDSVARQVYEGLPARAAVGVEDLAVRCGLPALDVVRALPVLQGALLLETAGGAVRRAQSPTGPGAS